MRRYLAAVGILIFAACGSVPGSRAQSDLQAESNDPAITFLLNSAAADFHAHQPPTGFRRVRAGSVATASGTKQYLLCGEFLPAAANVRAGWSEFATVQTSGYEQYVGSQAANVCKNPAVIWQKADFTSLLQARVESLRAP